MQARGAIPSDEGQTKSSDWQRLWKEKGPNSIWPHFKVPSLHYSLEVASGKVFLDFFSTVEHTWWIWWCEILLYGNDVRPNHKHFTEKRRKKFCGVHEWKASTSSRLEWLETTYWRSWPSCCHSLLSSLSALPVNVLTLLRIKLFNSSSGIRTKV